MLYTNTQEESSPHCFDSFIFKTFVKSWAKPLGHWEYSVTPSWDSKGPVDHWTQCQKQSGSYWLHHCDLILTSMLYLKVHLYGRFQNATLFPRALLLTPIPYILQCISFDQILMGFPMGAGQNNCPTQAIGCHWGHRAWVLIKTAKMIWFCTNMGIVLILDETQQMQ